MPNQITHRGVEFQVEHRHDEWNAEPWNDDGHGIVTAWIDPEEGEIPTGARKLTRDGRCWRYYDWGATLIKAREERWGLSDEARGRAELQRGRALTADEIITAAVEADYAFIWGWCADEWSYIGVIIRIPGTGLSASLWGIESNAGEYLDRVARELADQILDEDLEPYSQRIEEIARAAGVVITGIK